jgi:hypothetical protein
MFFVAAGQALRAKDCTELGDRSRGITCPLVFSGSVPDLHQERQSGPSARADQVSNNTEVCALMAADWFVPAGERGSAAGQLCRRVGGVDAREGA